MLLPVIIWRWIKTFNCNNYFRENIHRMKYIGVFQIRHPSHNSIEKEGLIESVTFHDYDEKEKEYTMKRLNYTHGQAPYIRKVKKNQIYLKVK